MTEWSLVTGGAKRLGAAICRSLAKRGHAVVIHYNTSQKEAELLKEELRAMGAQAETIQGAFTSAETVQEFLERYTKRVEKTKHLINNIGAYVIKKCLNIAVEEEYSLFQSNVHTPFLLIRGLVPSLQQCTGRIINIGTSGVNAQRINAMAPMYYASKSALFILTKALAKELASLHISVNMVSPGVLENSVDVDQVSCFPMKRPATVEEVARIVAFLLEPENGYITGQDIEVAGGMGL